MRLIDTFPTNKIGDLEYCAGRVFPFGATIIDGGVNFSIFSKEATGCTLVLYHHGQKERGDGGNQEEFLGKVFSGYCPSGSFCVSAV